MGLDCDSFGEIDLGGVAHPRLLRLVGDRDRGLRVRAAGVLLDALALLQRVRRRTAPTARPALVLSVDATGVWVDCDRCGVASWPVDRFSGDVWVQHLARCSGGAS